MAFRFRRVFGTVLLVCAAAAYPIYRAIHPVPKTKTIVENPLAADGTYSWSVSGRAEGSDNLDFEVRDSKGNVVDALLITGLTDGTFDASFQLKPGAYDLYVFTGPSLKKLIKKAANPKIDIVDLKLSFYYGDLDRDNYVSPAEVAYVAKWVGKKVDLSLDAPYDILRADLDGDRIISAAEAATVAACVGKRDD